MSEEQSNSVQPEKSSVTTQNQESSQNNGSEVKQLNFSESAIKNAGGQGVSLKPVGSHTTNPFTSQDVTQAQPPTQVQPSSQIVTPPPSDASGNSSSNNNAGE